MKKLLPFLLLSLFALSIQAQNAITVTPGTDLYISGSDILYVDGLTLKPSSAFTLNGVAISKNSSLSNPGLPSSILKSYLFSAPTTPFLGTIRLDYDNADLNSANESQLQMQVYNGSVWQLGGATTRDAVNNYVEVTGLNNYTLEELTLSTTNALPLSWNSVTAYRNRGGVIIQWSTAQETAVHYFSVERNVNGAGWQLIADGIEPHNNTSLEKYTYMDSSYHAQKLYYRIRETDIDGRHSYSPLMSVAAEATNNVKIYPNPITNEFNIQLNHATSIKAVYLYHTSGSLVRSWKNAQRSYNVSSLTPGMYQLCIITKEGNKYFIPLIKK